MLNCVGLGTPFPTFRPVPIYLGKLNKIAKVDNSFVVKIVVVEIGLTVNTAGSSFIWMLRV